MMYGWLLVVVLSFLQDKLETSWKDDYMEVFNPGLNFNPADRLEIHLNSPLDPLQVSIFNNKEIFGPFGVKIYPGLKFHPTSLTDLGDCS